MCTRLISLLAIFTFLGFANGISILGNGRFKGGLWQQPPSSLNHEFPPEQWFEQKLDHFNDANTRTWNQRYFVNDSFYTTGGPVFVLIGGEGEASPVWMVEGQWINWAHEFGALCIQVEHRYYGKSHPTEDLSVKNLQYLSSEQALADLATFRSQIAETFDAQNSKWIFLGGSYAGSLAAWMRLKYPHLVNGAVATSAPLLAEINFPTFLDVVQNAISQVSNSCISAISAAVTQIENALATKEGQKQLSDKFRLCSPLNASIDDDVTNLYYSLARIFKGVVQLNKDNIQAYEGNMTSNITIDTLCNIMDNETIGDEIDRYAAVNSLHLDSYNQECLDHVYSEMIDKMRNISWESEAAEGIRQWQYQTCTEFGFYTSSDSKNQPFGQKFPLNFFVKQCADIYGPKFDYTLLDSGVKQTNIIYGELSIQITKVIFPNGSMDPWHVLGVLHDLNPEAKAIFIEGTAHCADMFPDDPSDLPQLVQARATIKQEIQRWIA